MTPLTIIIILILLVAVVNLGGLIAILAILSHPKVESDDIWSDRISLLEPGQEREALGLRKLKADVDLSEALARREWHRVQEFEEARIERERTKRV